MATTVVYPLSLHDALPISIGPSQGMSEMWSAALAPVRARTSALFSLSLERTVAMICVSFLNPSGKSGRSEEHTSELQSQFHIVCRLLLEKKTYSTLKYTSR